MCKLLGYQLTTLGWPYHYYINKNEADDIFKKYENFIKTFTHIIFTDTSMVARPFLQNLSKHNCGLIIYITNRLNWGIWEFEDTHFNELYSTTSFNERVTFTSDNKYDMFFAQDLAVFFKDKSITRLIPYIEPDDIIRQPLNNRFFVYNRGTNIEYYQEELKTNEIEYDVYGEGFSRFKNQAHICEYLGIIHLPYQVNIQSLYENLAYNIIYFIPSYDFIQELLKSKWYYWEEKDRTTFLLQKSIELSEWYTEENRHLFVYFDSWEDLKKQTRNIDVVSKKRVIQKHMRENQEGNLQKWQKYLN